LLLGDIADLKAAVDLEMDLKILRMNRNGMPQNRITRRLGIPQKQYRTI
jgi:hypothetical protein